MVDRLRSRRRRVVLTVFTVAALGTAALAPLATGSGAAGAVTINGASSLSDKVAVQFKKPSKDSTSDVHVLAFNDFHGNLEPGRPEHLRPVRRRRRLPGQGDQGQAGARTAGPTRPTVFAGDNIGASPLANGLFHEEPATIVTNLMHVDFASVGNHEFDKGKDELLRIQNGGCPAGGCTGAPYAAARRPHHQPLPGRQLPVPVGERDRRRHRPDAVPGVRHQAVQGDTRRQGQRRLHRRGAQGHARPS